MGRPLYALAAVLCAQGLAGTAQGEPRAVVQGEMDADLRAAIAQALGDTDRPIENRFEARRRARVAAEDAIAVLRSEGHYANVVEPIVSEADPPTAIVRIEPGPRFTLAQPAIDWRGEAPDQATRTAAETALGLAAGGPGRAPDVIAGGGIL